MTEWLTCSAATRNLVSSILTPPLNYILQLTVIFWECSVVVSIAEFRSVDEGSIPFTPITNKAKRERDVTVSMTDCRSVRAGSIPVADPNEKPQVKAWGFSFLIKRNIDCVVAPR